jgi:integrase
MASLQERGGSYRVLFSWHGKLHSFTIGKVSPDEAEAKARQVDYLLMRLKQRLVHLPEGSDIVSFVRFDGRPPTASPTLPESPRKSVTLSHLKDRYLATHGNGTVEANSLATAAMHLRHFCRVLGDGQPLGELSLATLQAYIDRRSRDGVCPTTIRKEIATLRAAWNWGEPMKLTGGVFPASGLRYPKAEEKPPFMTRSEIERQIAAGGRPDVLWDCLYLHAGEISDLLGFVKAHAAHPWIYPLFCFAAHTGARRSEILRVLVADLDLTGNTVLIRENKRDRTQRTHRRVPLTPFLTRVLKSWLKAHPGGPYLFCQSGTVGRSKKRSSTTGYRGEKTRPSSLKGRTATVRPREAVPQAALTRDEVRDHFKRTLKGSAWQVLRGLHCLRHSFISACASKGVDQRLVQEWCGHMDEATSRRYRHLWPSVQQEAIKGVFA